MWQHRSRTAADFDPAAERPWFEIRRLGIWFPLVLFGILALVGSVLYSTTDLSSDEFMREQGCQVIETQEPQVQEPRVQTATCPPGAKMTQTPRWPPLYWLVAGVLGYVWVVGYFRRLGDASGHSFGARARITVAAVLGASFLANFIVVWFASTTRGANRGFAPFLGLAVALVVLAVIARSPALGLIALAVGILGGVGELYNVENLIFSGAFSYDTAAEYDTYAGVFAAVRVYIGVVWAAIIGVILLVAGLLFRGSAQQTQIERQRWAFTAGSEGSAGHG